MVTFQVSCTVSYWSSNASQANHCSQSSLTLVTALLASSKYKDAFPLEKSFQKQTTVSVKTLFSLKKALCIILGSDTCHLFSCRNLSNVRGVREAIFRIFSLLLFPLFKKKNIELVFTACHFNTHQRTVPCGTSAHRITPLIAHTTSDRSYFFLPQV